MRRHPQVAGYVITEFTDVNWECNGLLDMARNRKVFHDRLKDLQAQDILIPRLSPRTAFWEGETAMLSVEFSCFSGHSVSGGTLHWDVEGIAGMAGDKARAIRRAVRSRTGVRLVSYRAGLDYRPACGAAE